MSREFDVLMGKGEFGFTRKCLIEHLAKRAEQAQELEVYVDENTKKTAELNAFLQKQGATKHLGKHVIDAVMEHVRELETNCIHCNGKGFNGLDYCPNCVRGEIIRENMELEQQNKRYREAINDYFEIDGDYKEIADKAERIFRRVLEGAQ